LQIADEVLSCIKGAKKETRYRVPKFNPLYFSLVGEQLIVGNLQ